MAELVCAYMILQCAAVFYLGRFLVKEFLKRFTGSPVCRIPSFNRTGVWGYILLLVSIALTAPMMIGDSPQEDDPSGSQPTPSLINMFTPAMSLRSILPTYERSSSRSSPTLELDTIELAQYNGYGAERHTVTTSDGYILGVHRIYNSSVGGGATPKPVVVIHHAFVLNSREFLTLGPTHALGYLLADAGYDVWLCNARGNTYSRKHTNLSPDEKDFWDFSFTELATYDIPAVIDYALSVTGTSKVHYIGHSIGTISFFVMGSKKPDVLSKVKSFTALAPVTATTNARSEVFKTFIINYQLISNGLEQVGVNEFLPHTRWLTLAGNTICQNGWPTQRLCTAFISALCGGNPKFNSSILPEMLHHSPSGSSIKTFRHLGQNHFNGFREYDYGVEENLAKYNSQEPPLFDYSKINVTSQLFYGKNDLLADYKDAVKICKTLPNVYLCEEVEEEHFGHVDFIWSSNAATLVYSKIIKGLRFFDNVEKRSLIK